MKKIYLIIISIFFAASMSAQSFSVEKDTVRMVMKNYLDYMNNYVKNETSTPIQVSWRVFDHNLPQDWIDSAKYGHCDNGSCYPKNILGGTTKMTMPIKAGEKMPFKGQMSGESPSVISTGTYYYAVELTEGSTIDTVVYITSNFPTSVKSVTATAPEVSLYPNPARNNLNISVAGGENIQYVGIYNLVGKQTGSYKINDNKALLNISDLPTGVYFARFFTASGKLITSKKFTKQ